MNNKLKFNFKFLQRINEVALETIYLLIIFLVPLWFSYLFPTYNLFELSKLAIFKGLTCLLLIFSVFRFIIYFYFSSNEGNYAVVFKNLKVAFKKYFFFAILLLFGLGVSLFFSLNWQQSFFGSYERQQGLISFLFYFIFAALMFTNLFFDRYLVDPYFGFSSLLLAKIRRIIIVATLSGSLVAIYGILQIMNIDFLTWPEPPYLTGRTLSTLGQPNFLASFLLLVIPLAFYLAYVSRRFLLRFFFSLLALIQIVCLFFTSSRGGLLAFLAVIVLFGLYLFFHSQLNKKIKLAAILGVVILGMSGLFTLEMINPGRLSGSFDFKKGSLAARVYFFQAAADAVITKPMFGYGLENSGEVFIRYYERDWGIYGDVSANTDRAHNIVLDILLWTGAIGLTLFVLWYYSILKLAWKQIKLNKNKSLAIALLAGIIGYLISLLFSFMIVAGEVYFWLFFALLAVMGANEEINFSFRRSRLNLFFKKIFFVEKIKNLGRKIYFKRTRNLFFCFKRLGPLFLALLLIFFAACQLKQAGKTILADYYQNEIHGAINKMEFVRASLLREKIIDLEINPIQMNSYDSYLGNYLANFCFFSDFRDKAEEKILINKLALIYTSLSDYGYQNIFLKARIAACLKDYEAAEYYFSELEKITPYWPLGYLNHGLYLVKKGDLALAEKYYQLADFSLPDLNSEFINNEHKEAAAIYKYLMYNNLGEAYLKNQNYARAEKFFQEAFRYRPEDYSLFKKIADTYYLRGEFDSALKYIKKGEMASPTDYNWPLAAAAILFEKGLNKEAMLEIEKVKNLAPAESIFLLENLKTIYNFK